MANSGIKVAVGDLVVNEHDASAASLVLNGKTVVKEQGAVIAAVTPAADGTAAGTTLNLVIAELKRHGLIASS